MPAPETITGEGDTMNADTYYTTEMPPVDSAAYFDKFLRTRHTVEAVWWPAGREWLSIESAPVGYTLTSETHGWYFPYATIEAARAHVARILSE